MRLVYFQLRVVAFLHCYVIIILPHFIKGYNDGFSFATDVEQVNSDHSIRCIYPSHTPTDHLIICTLSTVSAYTIANDTYELVAGRYGTFGHKEGFANQAEFNNPRSIVKYSYDELIVLDSSNFCLRSIRNQTTSSFVGKCTSSDDQVGNWSQIRLYSPDGMALFNNKDIYVTEPRLNHIKVIHLQTKTAETIYIPEIMIAPLTLHYDRTRSSLYATTKYGILANVSLNSQPYLIAGTFGQSCTSACKYGPLQNSTLRKPINAFLLTSTLFLMIFRNPNHLVLMNLTADTLTLLSELPGINGLNERITSLTVPGDGYLYIGTIEGFDSKQGLYRLLIQTDSAGTTKMDVNTSESSTVTSVYDHTVKASMFSTRQLKSRPDEAQQTHSYIDGHYSASTYKNNQKGASSNAGSVAILNENSVQTSIDYHTNDATESEETTWEISSASALSTKGVTGKSRTAHPFYPTSSASESLTNATMQISTARATQPPKAATTLLPTPSIEIHTTNPNEPNKKTNEVSLISSSSIPSITTNSRTDDISYLTSTAFKAVTQTTTQLPTAMLTHPPTASTTHYLSATTTPPPAAINTPPPMATEHPTVTMTSLITEMTQYIKLLNTKSTDESNTYFSNLGYSTSVTVSKNSQVTVTQTLSSTTDSVSVRSRFSVIVLGYGITFTIMAFTIPATTYLAYLHQYH